MESNFPNILRFGLAAFNGLLFSVGLFIILEILVFRPKKWKARMLWLLRQVNKNETELSADRLKEYENELEVLRHLINTWKQDPKILLQVAFGGIMICMALFAILSLLVPSANPFL
jgi:hypothetical protein